MNNNPLVSILSPCYNVEKYLPKCLDTIIGQTYSNLQIVLIDDGSKDGSWKIMQEYAVKDSRIEIYHQDNKGVATTRNNLLDKVKGDFVLFVDSDDWIELDMVDYLVRKAIDNDSSVVTCGMVQNDDPFDLLLYNEEIWERPKVICEFLRHVSFRGSLWNKLVATSLLHNIRFHCGISYGEDALFCWGFLQYADIVVVTNKILYHYRMNMDSISHKSFGSKKLTGHETWHIITEETAKLWPQYIEIAQARWGMEDMYLLRQAGQSGYKKNESIKLLQKTVRGFLSQMRIVGLLKGREILNAYILSVWYEYGYLYSFLNKVKNRLK